ncbi:MAG: sodium-dependent transporter [Gammaproteobacteria bacterium]
MVNQSGRLWQKRGTFVMAAAASAIGLGNIWRFPHELGTNGGSAFLFIYLACIALVCLPVMLAEALIGRVGGKGPVQSFSVISRLQGKSFITSSFWPLIGLMGALTGFMIASFYSVVGGWTLAYLLDAIVQGSTTTSEGSQVYFSKLESRVGFEILMMLLFIGLTAAIVYQGVVKGLERFLRILTPAILIMLVVLMLYSFSVGSPSQGLAYMFSPDFSKLSWGIVLKAMGHAFFSLSLGMGVLITFGSYTPKDQNLGQMILLVGVLDTLVALLAAAVIFPLVFAFDNLQVNAGPSLVFVALPQIFSVISWGGVFQIVFFALLLVAALSSMVSIVEPAISALENYFGWKRAQASHVIFGLVSALGIGCALDSAVFNTMDFVSANVLLPLGGILIALYVGWVLKPELYTDQVGLPTGLLRRIWMAMVCVVSPACIGWVLYNGLFNS